MDKINFMNRKLYIEDLIIYVLRGIDYIETKKGGELMRKLDTIQTKENLNDIYAIDNIGPGGANHQYMIVPSGTQVTEETLNYGYLNKIQMQCGPRNETNLANGLLPNDLLEIARDILKGFQSGDFANIYNEKALGHIEIALLYLNKRVEDRIKRQVLGKYEK